jgi:ABC-type phosphate/phosphonate transport system ATPase subunit
MKDPDHPQAVGGSESSTEGNATAVDQRAFRDGYEPAAGDVFIAILGVTGAGKVVLTRCLSAHSC